MGRGSANSGYIFFLRALYGRLYIQYFSCKGSSYSKAMKCKIASYLAQSVQISLVLFLLSSYF